MDYPSSLDPNTNPFDLHFATKLPVSLNSSDFKLLSVQFLTVAYLFLFLIQKREVSDSASAKILVKDEVSS